MRMLIPNRPGPLACALALLWVGLQVVQAQGDNAPSLDYLQAQVAAHPERIDLVLALGNAAAAAGKLDVAIAGFQKVLDTVEPDSPEAGDLDLRIGEAYRRKGDREAAIAWLSRASELLPDQPVVRGTLALVLDASGEKEAAEREYRATLELDPENAVAMNNLAFLLAERGRDLDEALGLAQSAVALMPGDAEILDTTGWVRLKRNETGAAIDLFASAWLKSPGNDEYRRHLLLALERKTDRNPVMDELKSLLAGEVSPSATNRALELLKAVANPSR